MFLAVVGRMLERAFGFVGLSFWLAIAVLPVAISGLVHPPSVGGVYRLWRRVTEPIGRGISLALLTGVYFAVMTPLGLIMRLFGVDPARRRWQPGSSTYWVPHPRRSDDSYFRPF